MLTTIAKVKGQLGIPIEDTSEDNNLNMYIMAASQAIESFCRRSFKKQTYTEVLDGSGSSFLVLRNFPVFSGVATMDKDQFAVEANEDGILFLPKGWNTGQRSITVRYEAGYVLPGDDSADNPRTLPEAVEVACIFVVQGMLQNPTAIGVKSERVGDVSVTYGDTDALFSSTVQALLSPYVGRWV
ncbi:hypothetical protein ABE82_07430 [Paenibacillus peoriae]|uniref:phage head-tail connector protein n=1 Tax=Paenibacillus peoriae TaxID=59893 RepID=UPI0006A6AFCB|nr:phage head-tail connector protein [Paenibacillus peoriae]ALA41358.1 hypothetical protein ABE82_07430 [Paenibacillus peoriae]